MRSESSGQLEHRDTPAPPPQQGAVRDADAGGGQGRLFDAATSAIREALGVKSGGEYGFDIPIALLRARRPGA